MHQAAPSDVGRSTTASAPPYVESPPYVNYVTTVRFYLQGAVMPRKDKGRLTKRSAVQNEQVSDIPAIATVKLKFHSIDYRSEILRSHIVVDSPKSLSH